MKRLCLIFMFLFFSGMETKCLERPFYICTYSDSNFFDHLINLINSLHKFNFNEIKEIAVFDLGLDENQLIELKSIRNINVYEVEMVHKDLLTYFKTNNNGRQVRGWFAWKPVVIKQALDMFPYVISMDAGLMILKPMNEMFEEVWNKDYLVAGVGCSIAWMTPKHVIETFDLYSEERKWILDESTEGISGACMGLTRVIYDDFVLPMYNFAHNINHFIDDGTTPNGFGTARHDQTLFSIQASLLGFNVPCWYDQARILHNGKRYPCLYKDIVIRAHHILNVHENYSKIREFIRYKD